MNILFNCSEIHTQVQVFLFMKLKYRIVVLLEIPLDLKN